MKFIALISFVLTVGLSFGQTVDEIRSDVRIHFSGTIEFDSTDATISSVMIFQDSILNIVNSDTTGKYRIIASVNIKKPFSLIFSCTGCVEKTLLFNYGQISLDHPSLVIRPFKPIEVLDIEMIPVNPNFDIHSFNIARFYWNERTRLDEDFSQLQELKIENYRANIDTTKRTYHEKGQLYRIVPMKDGSINGTILYYDEHGLKTREMNVKNGELNGESMTYDSNGRVKRKSIYTKGEFEKGQYYYYSNDGELTKTVQF